MSSPSVQCFPKYSSQETQTDLPSINSLSIHMLNSVMVSKKPLKLVKEHKRKKLDIVYKALLAARLNHGKSPLILLLHYIVGVSKILL